MTDRTLAQQVADAMLRRRELDAQREAAATLLRRYWRSPSISRWCRRLLGSSRVGRYRLLYRVAERAA